MFDNTYSTGVRMMNAPIALFVYNRPEHTKKVLEALVKNDLAKDTPLYVFSDGPRDEIDNEKVESVRKIIKSISGFAKLEIFEKKSNSGLSKSLTSGITDIIGVSGKIIVLEDDIITSRTFLYNMNKALSTYEDNDSIFAVSGFTFPHDIKLPEKFACYFPAVWGWATWESSWELYNADSRDLFNSLKAKNLLRVMDHEDSFPYSKMLEDEIKGIIDSWGIKWYASEVLAGKSTLMFGNSLVKNIGHDKSGRHSDQTGVHEVDIIEADYFTDNIIAGSEITVQNALKAYLHSVLYDSFLKLTDVCYERLILINDLQKIARESLNSLNDKSGD